MKLKTILLCFGLIIKSQFANTQNFKTTKYNPDIPLTEQSVIYALPRTSLNIKITVTQTKITRGIYAKYAQKFLGLQNVPLSDSSFWTINNIEIKPFNEPDPEHLYLLTFKTFPENLRSLLSINNQGIILNPTDKWLEPFKLSLGVQTNVNPCDPYILDETLKEQVDTLYKTILNDTGFVKIPVFKKQIMAKSEEELAKETAHQLIKTRKLKTKYARGEYDYHPDAQTLKVMLSEMEKIERNYLSLFQGTQSEIKKVFSFTVFPRTDQTEIPICSFSKKYGLDEKVEIKSNTLFLQLKNTQLPTPPSTKIITPQQSNALYFRVPSYVNSTITLNETILMNDRVPVYQFGTVQILPIIK